MAQQYFDPSHKPVLPGGLARPATQRAAAVHGNAILAALPGEELERMLPQMRSIELQKGDCLCEFVRPMEYVYFPTNVVVALVTAVPEGKTVRVGIVGREGFVGVPALLGRVSGLIRAVVQIAGSAFRMDARSFKGALAASPSLQRRSFDYVHHGSVQLAQFAACNHFHKVQERLAGWLTLVHDRCDGDALSLTQESLADLLGCRRSSVTDALASLQRAGVIRCGRAKVHITDRGRLKEVGCECGRVLGT